MKKIATILLILITVSLLFAQNSILNPINTYSSVPKGAYQRTVGAFINVGEEYRIIFDKNNSFEEIVVDIRDTGLYQLNVSYENKGEWASIEYFVMVPGTYEDPRVGIMTRNITIDSDWIGLDAGEKDFLIKSYFLIGPTKLIIGLRVTGYSNLQVSCNVVVNELSSILATYDVVEGLSITGRIFGSSAKVYELNVSNPGLYTIGVQQTSMKKTFKLIEAKLKISCSDIDVGEYLKAYVNGYYVGIVDQEEEIISVDPAILNFGSNHISFEYVNESSYLDGIYLYYAELEVKYEDGYIDYDTEYFWEWLDYSYPTTYGYLYVIERAVIGEILYEIISGKELHYRFYLEATGNFSSETSSMYPFNPYITYLERGIHYLVIRGLQPMVTIEFNISFLMRGEIIELNPGSSLNITFTLNDYFHKAYAVRLNISEGYLYDLSYEILNGSNWVSISLPFILREYYDMNRLSNNYLIDSIEHMYYTYYPFSAAGYYIMSGESYEYRTLTTGISVISTERLTFDTPFTRSGDFDIGALFSWVNIYVNDVLDKTLSDRSFTAPIANSQPVLVFIAWPYGDESPSDEATFRISLREAGSIPTVDASGELPVTTGIQGFISEEDPLYRLVRVNIREGREYRIIAEALGENAGLSVRILEPRVFSLIVHYDYAYNPFYTYYSWEYVKRDSLEVFSVVAHELYLFIRFSNTTSSIRIELMEENSIDFGKKYESTQLDRLFYARLSLQENHLYRINITFSAPLDYYSVIIVATDGSGRYPFKDCFESPAYIIDGDLYPGMVSLPPLIFGSSITITLESKITGEAFLIFLLWEGIEFSITVEDITPPQGLALSTAMSGIGGFVLGLVVAIIAMTYLRRRAG